MDSVQLSQLRLAQSRREPFVAKFWMFPAPTGAVWVLGGSARVILLSFFLQREWSQLRGFLLTASYAGLGHGVTGKMVPVLFYMAIFDFFAPWGYHSTFIVLQGSLRTIFTSK